MLKNFSGGGKNDPSGASQFLKIAKGSRGVDEDAECCLATIRS
jgi:hypothetical protein